MAMPAASMFALLAGASALVAASEDPEHARLKALEVESHQQWLARDVGALSRLMDDAFRFVAMNGAVESRAHVLGAGGTGSAAPPSPMTVRSITVHPEEIVVRADTGIVISTIHIDASVRGRPLPPRMRVLTVFTRNGEDWTLLARSVTPIQQRPAERPPVLPEER
jgi:hypothetical protein